MTMNETMEHSAAVKNGVKRLALTGVAIVLEVLFILLVVLRFNEQAEWFAIGTRVVSTLLVLLIYNDLKTASMKMTWIILIMALPIFGATLYLLIGLNGHTFKMRRRYAEVDARQGERELPLIPTRGRSSLVSRDAASVLEPPGAGSGPSAAPSSAPGARVPTPQAPTLSGFRLPKRKVEYVAMDR